MTAELHLSKSPQYQALREIFLFHSESPLCVIPEPTLRFKHGRSVSIAKVPFHPKGLQMSCGFLFLVRNYFLLGRSFSM